MTDFNKKLRILADQLEHALHHAEEAELAIRTHVRETINNQPWANPNIQIVDHPVEVQPGHERYCDDSGINVHVYDATGNSGDKCIVCGK